MKCPRLFIALMLFISVVACDEKAIAPDMIEAEVLGQDYSRWICGGGWFIATSTDTITVHEIPDAEIMSILSGSGHTEAMPIKVNLVFNESPSSTCAIEFDSVKELDQIILRN